MLNIDEIQNGIVIDHIKAGTAIGLMDLLGIKGNRTSSVGPEGHHQGGGRRLLAQPRRAGLSRP